MDYPKCRFRPPSGVFQKAAYEFVPEAIGSEIGWIGLLWLASILRIGLDWRQRRLSAGLQKVRLLNYLKSLFVMILCK